MIQSGKSCTSWCATTSLSSGRLQITCTVSNATRGGLNAVDVIVGHKGRAALPGGGLTLLVDTLAATTVIPTPLSTIGASRVTITGSGYDAETCDHNEVVLGGVPCAVLECTGSALVVTYPGDADAATAAANVDTESAPSARTLAITVRDASGAALQAEEYAGLASVTSGGASAPYCALAEGTAGSAFGATATLQLRCSAAAVAAGVVQLHVVPAAAAGVASAASSASGRRRLQHAHVRRLSQEEQPSSFPSVSQDELPPEAPDAIVCKARLCFRCLPCPAVLARTCWCIRNVN